MITPAEGEAADADRVRESIDMAVFSAVPDFVRVTVKLDGLGTGGAAATAAARALLAHSNLGAVEIVRTALEIASGIDVYTNTNIVVEELACEI